MEEGQNLFTAGENWTEAPPGMCTGALAVRGVENPEACAALDERKASLEDGLRQRYAGMDRSGLAALPVLRAYEAYYRGFRKTYHVQLQLESLLFKGKSIPSVSALVEAMFMAELENLLLTAGHDLDQLALPVRVGNARGDETYVMMRGETQTLKPGDVYMSDRVGVISSIIYGPDGRTRITPATQAALFTVYAPPGIGAAAVAHHLERIAEYIRLVSPGAKVDAPIIFEA
jgi:DNA/RNA-binding domain of Phe-tRNA-synthetase-like protein